MKDRSQDSQLCFFVFFSDRYFDLFDILINYFRLFPIQDTLAAWEALKLYSDKMGTNRDTKLAITVEPLLDVPNAIVLNYPFSSDDGDVPSHTFYIGDKNLLEPQQEVVSPEWGSARVRAKGKGWSVVQLTAKYHVTDEHHLQVPPVRAFTITTKVWPSSQTAIQVRTIN